MPTAIKLTTDNIDLIADVLHISNKDVTEMWYETRLNPRPHYYIKDPLYFLTRVPYLIYTEREFLDDFACIPPGIEDQFVPVKQIRH